MTLRIAAIAVAAAAVLSACGPGGEGASGPLMNPGENCISCHAANGSAAEKTFTVAGSVFAGPKDQADGGLSGVTITITDASGTDTVLTSNAAGNFYSKAKLSLPLKKATVTRNGKTTAMSGVPSPACASCHTDPPTGGAPGRVYAP